MPGQQNDVAKRQLYFAMSADATDVGIDSILKILPLIIDSADLEELLVAALSLQPLNKSMILAIYERLIQIYQSEEKMLEELSMTSLGSLYATKITSEPERILKAFGTRFKTENRVTYKELSQFLSCKIDGRSLFDWIVSTNDEVLISYLFLFISEYAQKPDVGRLPTTTIGNPDTINVLSELSMQFLIKRHSASLPADTFDALTPTGLLYYLMYATGAVVCTDVLMTKLLSLEDSKLLLIAELVVHHHQWPSDSITSLTRRLQDVLESQSIPHQKIREEVFSDQLNIMNGRPALLSAWLKHWIRNHPGQYPVSKDRFIILCANIQDKELSNLFVTHFDQIDFYHSLHDILMGIYTNADEKNVEIAHLRFLHQLLIGSLNADPFKLQTLPEEIRTDLLLSLVKCIPHSIEYQIVSRAPPDDMALRSSSIVWLLKNDARTVCGGPIAQYFKLSGQPLLSQIFCIFGSDVGSEVYHSWVFERDRLKLNDIPNLSQLVRWLSKNDRYAEMLEVLRLHQLSLPPYYFPEYKASNVSNELLKDLATRGLFVGRSREEGEWWLKTCLAWLEHHKDPYIATIIALTLTQWFGRRDLPKDSLSLKEKLKTLPNEVLSFLYRLIPPYLECVYPIEKLPAFKSKPAEKKIQRIKCQRALFEAFKESTISADGKDDPKIRPLAEEFMLALAMDLSSAPARNEQMDLYYEVVATILFEQLPFFISHHCVDIFLRCMQRLPNSFMLDLRQKLSKMGNNEQERLDIFLAFFIYDIQEDDLRKLTAFLKTNKKDVFAWFSTPQRYCGIKIAPINLMLSFEFGLDVGSSPQFVNSYIRKSPCTLIKCLEILLGFHYPFLSEHRDSLIYRLKAIILSINGDHFASEPEKNVTIQILINLIHSLSMENGSIGLDNWAESDRRDIEVFFRTYGQEERTRDLEQQRKKLEVFEKAQCGDVYCQLKYMENNGYRPGELLGLAFLGAAHSRGVLYLIHQFFSEANWTDPCINALTKLLEKKERRSIDLVICMAMLEKNPQAMRSFHLNTLLALYLCHADLPSKTFIKNLMQMILEKMNIGQTLEADFVQLIGSTNDFESLMKIIAQVDDDRLLDMCHLLSAFILSQKNGKNSREALKTLNVLEKLLADVYQEHKFRLMLPFNRLLAGSPSGECIAALLAFEGGQSLLSPLHLRSLFDFAIQHRIPTLLSTVLSLYEKWGHKVQTEILSKRKEELLPLLIEVAKLNHVGIVSVIAECLEAALLDIKKEDFYNYLRNIYCQIGEKIFKNISWQSSLFGEVATLVIINKGADLESKHQEERRALDEFDKKYQDIQQQYNKIAADLEKEQELGTNIDALNKCINQLMSLKLVAIKLSVEEKRKRTTNKESLLKQMQSTLKNTNNRPVREVLVVEYVAEIPKVPEPEPKQPPVKLNSTDSSEMGRRPHVLPILSSRAPLLSARAPRHRREGKLITGQQKPAVVASAPPAQKSEPAPELAPKPAPAPAPELAPKPVPAPAPQLSREPLPVARPITPPSAQSMTPKQVLEARIAAALNREQLAKERLIEVSERIAAVQNAQDRNKLARLAVERVLLNNEQPVNQAEQAQVDPKPEEIIPSPDNAGEGTGPAVNRPQNFLSGDRLLNFIKGGPVVVGCNLENNPSRFEILNLSGTGAEEQRYAYRIKGMESIESNLCKLFMPPDKIVPGFMTSSEPLTIGKAGGGDMVMTQALESIVCRVVDFAEVQPDQATLIGYTNTGNLPVYRKKNSHEEFILFGKNEAEGASQKLFILVGQEPKLVNIIAPTVTAEPRIKRVIPVEAPPSASGKGMFSNPSTRKDETKPKPPPFNSFG